MTEHLYGFTDSNDHHAFGEDFLFTVCFKCHSELTRKEFKVNMREMSYEEAIHFKYKER